MNACRHCYWSEALPTLILWCRRHLRFAELPCKDWTREPGADDDL